MEHRWGDRRQVILRVRLYGPGELSAIGWLTDISLSGAYVKTMAALDSMSQIHIEVDEHSGGNTEAAPLQLQGRVVRHGSAGVGVEWEEFASGTLGDLVRIATSSPTRRTRQTPEGPQRLGVWTLAMSGVSNETSSGTEP
jgi:hypothetical protein